MDKKIDRLLGVVSAVPVLRISAYPAGKDRSRVFAWVQLYPLTSPEVTGVFVGFWKVKPFGQPNSLVKQKRRIYIPKLLPCLSPEPQHKH
jgi:hypothetical protein